MKWVSADEGLPNKAGYYCCALLDNPEGVTDYEVVYFDADGRAPIPSYQILTFWAPFEEPPLLTLKEIRSLIGQDEICVLVEGQDYRDGDQAAKG